MKRIRPISLWLASLLVIAVILLTVESDLLWKVQQFNLFLYSKLFFQQQMIVPGGMLSYIASFFTQYFFHAWLGVILLCGWLFLLMWMTKRTFRISDRWNILMLIPVSILILTNMELGYWHYVMKLRGYFFVPTIGTTLAVGMLWAFRCLPDKTMFKGIFIILATAVSYPLMGVYGLAAILLMGIITWRISEDKTQNAIVTVLAILSIVAVPLLYYRSVYYQANMDDIYLVELPVFIVREEFPLYYIPYYFLIAFFLIMAVTYGMKWSGKELPKYKYWGVQAAIMVVIIGCTWHFWYKDENFHHELTMQRCIERCYWKGVIDEGKKQETEPTRSIVMMYNLALSRLGIQCEEIYNFPKGSKKSNTPLPIYLYNVVGRLIYYQYGLPNECHRICMEDGVEYGWRIEILQYMARCALLNNETQAARKFLDLLRQTQYYDTWADYVEPLIDNKEKMAEALETAPIIHMMQYDDRLGSDNGQVEKFLMSLLAKIDSDDPYFQEHAVLGAMWTRNPDDFWDRFVQYARLHPHDKMPRIFQEAAYLFANMQHKNVEGVPFNKNVKESYHAFMKLLKQYDGAPIEQARAALYPTFGNTYYFEYFFLKDLTYL